MSPQPFTPTPTPCPRTRNVAIRTSILIGLLWNYGLAQTGPGPSSSTSEGSAGEPVANPLPAQPGLVEHDLTVTERGPNYRVIRLTASVLNPATGQWESQISHYTELQDGLHYWEGEWKEAQDLIEFPGLPERV
jgi:hypothetical protein